MVEIVVRTHIVILLHYFRFETSLIGLAVELFEPEIGGSDFDAIGEISINVL